MINLISLLLLNFVFATTTLPFNYAELQMRDIDEFEAFAHEKAKESEEAKSLDILVMALEVVLARPDLKDGVLRKTLPILKQAMDDQKAEAKAFMKVADRAIAALKKPEGDKTKQISYFFVLENMMSELKPRLKNDKWTRQVIEKIRDSEVELSPEAKKENRWRSMKKVSNLSETASKILPTKKDD